MKLSTYSLLAVALLTGFHQNNQLWIAQKAAPTMANTQENVTQILEKKDVEYAYPHWSKDGRQILYQSNESGRWQIYLMDRDGGNRQQLTMDSSNNNFPDWSPGNRHICFVSDRTGNKEIYTMEFATKKVSRLTDNDRIDIHPYWSPDSGKIYYNSYLGDEGGFEIFRMDRNGQNKQQITYTSDHETCARLSPNGGQLIYLRNNDRGLDDVYLMNLADGTARNLTQTPTRDGWPCWFPDGNRFIYSAMVEGVYKLFIYNLDNHSSQCISSPPEPYWDCRPNISPDGKEVVFNRQINGKRNTIGIYIMNLP